jgi:hypothetical protein
MVLTIDGDSVLIYNYTFMLHYEVLFNNQSQCAPLIGWNEKPEKKWF